MKKKIIEIDFDGNLKAELHVDYNSVKIIRAVNGYGDAIDIGITGLRFRSARRWDINQTLNVDFFIPGDSDPVRFKGTVVWSVENNEGDFITGIGSMVPVSGFEDRFLQDFMSFYSKGQ